MADKQRTTIEIDKKIYIDFQKNCKNHNLPINIVVEVLMERFNENQKSLGAKIKKYGKIEIAKQRVEQAQASYDGKTR